jgi:sulfane dehydrogenase subunit SoxC
MPHDRDPRPTPPRRLRPSRRALLAGAAGSAGVVALSRFAGAPLPLAAPSPQSPPVPEDPTKVPGTAPAPVGERAQFEHPVRIITGVTRAVAPLDQFYGIITPSALHYVISHGGVATVDPARHTLLIHGLVERPTVFTLADLKRFPSVSRILFLECGGNSNAAWKSPAPDTTVQQLHGLTSTSEWTGVPVATLLREVGASPNASWVLAEGNDAAVLSRSIPMAKLLDDAIVVYAQNGEALRPEQGYPMRLLLPGWVGNANVKWLRRLKLGDRPWQTRFETAQYSITLPTGRTYQFTFTMEAKSVITRPSGGMTLAQPGFWEVTGLAWSGRGVITRVEVSADGGKTWAEATLQEPILPKSHTRFRFPWVWEGGEAVLLSRARDETGYVQPTRDQLVAVRGTDSFYQFNGITGWQVARDGTVTYATS